MNKSELLEKVKTLLDRMKNHETPEDVTSWEELGPLLKDAEDLLETVSVLKYLMDENQEVQSANVKTNDQEVPENKEEQNDESPETPPITKPPATEEASVVVEEPLQEEDSEEPLETTISDSTDKASLNEMASPSNDMTSIASKLGNDAVDDLQSAIGLNEKFLFINELFDGDGDAYAVAVDKLNAFQHLPEALKYVRAELSDKYTWDQEQESTISFYALLERRYAD